MQKTKSISAPDMLKTKVYICPGHEKALPVSRVLHLQTSFDAGT